MSIHEVRPNPKIFLDYIIPFLELNKNNFFHFHCGLSSQTTTLESVKLFLLSFNEPINMDEFIELQINYIKHDLGESIYKRENRIKIISNWVQKNALDFRSQFMQRQVKFLELLNEKKIIEIRNILGV